LIRGTISWKYRERKCYGIYLRRKKLVKCYVWSIALYGAETWTLRAVDQKHLESLKCGAGEGWRSVGPRM
jgi:hypothetical protein